MCSLELCTAKQWCNVLLLSYICGRNAFITCTLIRVTCLLGWVNNENTLQVFWLLLLFSNGYLIQRSRCCLQTNMFLCVVVLYLIYLFSLYLETIMCSLYCRWHCVLKPLDIFWTEPKLKVHRFTNRRYVGEWLPLKYYSMKCFTFWENILMLILDNCFKNQLSILDIENNGFI